MSEREDGVGDSQLELNTWRYVALSRTQAEGKAPEQLANEKAESS